ncbi:type II secretion system F family protein [Actinospongicola halichondriae]|uniref:type II secretion system F family protein n=1 Tax=Actinospongicola halichondriae TaxID=3236844 RepID=UPI003D3F3CEC
MIRIVALSGMVFWVGATLALSQGRWFARRSLADRLRPYEPGGLASTGSGPGVLSVESFAEVVAPLARTVGERISRLLGVDEELAVRLDRIHSPLDPTGFRVRQLGWSAVGLVGGVLAIAAIRPPPLAALLFLVGGPLLSFLLIEQQLATESDRRKRRLFLELPVVSEQLGMLLSAGFSLGSALQRLAGRGQGVSGQDLRRVVARIRQGVGEREALREWAATADLDALTRLVAVLALNREAGDLGRLIAEEARSIRREVQRELIEQIERRSQQVWIPVTVAALVPGAIFIAIPFIQALQAFGVSS